MKTLLFVLALALLVYAAIDCSRAPASEIPAGLPRAAWLVLLLILPILGPILWLVASRSDRNHPIGGPRGGAGGGTRSGALPRAPRGPDDDPEFLHGL